MATDKKLSEEAPDPGDLYVDKRTEEKIKKHLTDETDVITEADIANAPAGLVNITSEGQLEDSVEKENNKNPLSKEEKLKDNEDPSIGTAWNLLES